MCLRGDDSRTPIVCPMRSHQLVVAIAECSLSGAENGAADTEAKLFEGKPINKYSLDDFDLLKVIGKGSFGKVLQVCEKRTKRIYAMKVMNS